MVGQLHLLRFCLAAQFYLQTLVGCHLALPDLEPFSKSDLGVFDERASQALLPLIKSSLHWWAIKTSSLTCYFFFPPPAHTANTCRVTTETGACHFTAANEDARRVQLCTCAEGRRGSSMNHLAGVSRDLSAAAKRQRRSRAYGMRLAEEPPPAPLHRYYRATPSQPQGHRPRRCFCFCLQARQTANKRPISNAIHLSPAAG